MEDAQKKNSHRFWVQTQLANPSPSNTLNEGPGFQPSTCQLPSTTGVHTPTPPCSVLQALQAQRFHTGVRCPAHNCPPPSIDSQSRPHIPKAFVLFCGFSGPHPLLLLCLPLSSFAIAVSHQVTKSPWYTIQHLLATHLPGQAGFFIGYVLLRAMLLMVDLLCVKQAVTAALRALLGPSPLTPGRPETWMGLRPLGVLWDLQHPLIQADLILILMITFVYAVMSPLVCVVTACGFACYAIVYRHQSLAVYSPDNDSGGQLWVRAARYVLGCMLVAQVRAVPHPTP